MEHMATTMSTAREGLGVVVLDGKMYTVGGFDSTDLSSVECLRPSDGPMEHVCRSERGQ